MDDLSKSNADLVITINNHARALSRELLSHACMYKSYLKETSDIPDSLALSVQFIALKNLLKSNLMTYRALANNEEAFEKLITILNTEFNELRDVKCT